MATKKEIMDLPFTPIDKGVHVKYKLPPKAFYTAIGAEAGMKELMYDFYDKIYESEISHFFPQDEEEFEEIKVKNAKFFIQICGGPKVYDNELNEVGLNEFMIRIHDDFSVTEKARVEWLGTIRESLADKAQHVELKLIEEFWDYLESFSKLAVNTFADGSAFYAAYEPGDIVS